MDEGRIFQPTAANISQQPQDLKLEAHQPMIPPAVPCLNKLKERPVNYLDLSSPPPRTPPRTPPNQTANDIARACTPATMGCSCPDKSKPKKQKNVKKCLKRTFLPQGGNVAVTLRSPWSGAIFTRIVALSIGIAAQEFTQSCEPAR